MPELPEVETIVQQLKKKVVGKKIVKTNILNQKMVDRGIKSITNTKVTEVYRRGKSIVIKLETNIFLLIHLRMSGHFHFLKKGQELEPKYEKQVVVKFFFVDGSILTHNSVRMFGHVKQCTQKQLEQEFSKLGPEPLTRQFTLDLFQEMLEKKKRSNIKSLLMEQAFLSGLGNIYAQEVLFHVQVSPSHKAGDLSINEIMKIYTEIKRLLKLAIKHQGTTVDNYSHIDGVGEFQKFLTVYHKQKCPKGHKIKNKMIGGRNTFYCPICQK